MATVPEFKKLFDKFIRENKFPTGEIVKKKYYFPLDQLKVITFSKIYKLIINNNILKCFFVDNLHIYAYNYRYTMVTISTNVDKLY